MVRVTVQMIPKGDETRARTLASMEITNDSTGTLETGNYVGTLHAEYTGPRGRVGKVMGFRRQKQSVWSLVGAFLKLWGHTRHPQKGMIETGRVMNKPTIVCLCGSSRFYKEYQIAEYQETMAGRIYLSIGFWPHAAEEMHGEGVGHNSEEKIALDELHKRKIDLADEVLVLNVGGYIGDSTRSEVAYAIENGKPVRWLEPDKAWHLGMTHDDRAY